MPPRKEKGDDTTKLDFTLPPLEVSASIFKDRKFSRELLPYKEGNNNSKRIKLTCLVCGKITYSGWPINTSNLNEHFRRKHYSEVSSSNNRDSDNSDNNNDSSSIATRSNIGSLDNYLKPSSSNNSLRKRKSFTLFDNNEYKRLLTLFLVNNNLPFSLIDDKTFIALLKYLKDDLPKVNRKSIRNVLSSIFNIESNKIKERLANNRGKFSITLDE